MRLPRFFGEGPYKQTAKKDLWLPVKGALVSFLIRCVPILAVAAEAVLIGRAFGLMALAVAVVAEAVNRSTQKKWIPTFWFWVVGLSFTFLWAFDAWPVPRRYLSYALLKSVLTMPGQIAGRYYVMWSFAGRAFVPMGAALFWRGVAIIALPFALPAPWSALNWRTLTEIVAPSFADSILYQHLRKDTEDTPPQRDNSAPLEGRPSAPLF